MAGLNMFPPSPLEEDLGYGEPPKSPKRKSTTQAAGLAGLAPSYVDVTALQERPSFVVPDLRAPTMGAEPPSLTTPTAAPKPAAPAAPVELPPYIAYSESAKKFFIGGQEIDALDAMAVDQAVSFLDAPSRPAPAKTATDWQPIARNEFLAFRNALATPRGFGEKVSLGAQEIAASTVGGIGRAIELAGAPETGQAIAGFAAESIGPSLEERSRSALIAENQGLLANIADAAIQSGLPSIGTTAAAGVAGFAVGGPLGASVGILGSIFFPELSSSYESAAQNGYDVNDPRVKAEILTATGVKTAVQSVFPATVYRGLSRTFQRAAESTMAPAVTKALTGRARVGAIGGEAITGALQEGTAEGLATLIDSVAFDPEFRSKLSVNDWKAIAPYVADKYGEDLLISFGAGAFVAGPISAGVKTLETRKPANLLERPPTEAAPTPAGGLTPEQQQIENLRKTFNVPAPDLFGGFLPTQTPPPDLSRTTTVLPTPPPSPEVQLPFAFGPQPQPQPPSAPTPATPTPAAPTPTPTPAAPVLVEPTPAAPTPAAPTPSAVERVGDNFIRFGTARIEVTDKGIGFQAPGVPSTLFYPDKGVFGDRRGEGRVSQMDERGVPKELQPIFRDYLAGRISKLDLDTIVTRLREVETNFQTPRQGIAAPTPEVPAPTAAEVREEIKALPNAQRRVLVAEYGNNTKLTQAIKSNPATVKGSLDAVKARQVPEGGQPERIGAGPQVQEVREDRNVQAVVAPGGPEAGRGDITPEGGQVAGAVTPPLSAEAKISNVPYFQQAQQTQPALARVITTDNVRAVGAFDPRYTGYIAGLLKATGLGKRRVIVINADELASIDNLSAPNFNIAASEFNDVKAAINDAKTIFQSGVTKGLAMMTNSGIGIIVRSPSTKGLFGITIAAHEVGHLVKWIAVHSAPWSTQVKLLEAHKKHLDNLLKTNPAGVPPSLKTFVESMRATPQARGEARLAPEFYANTLMTALRISDPAYFNYITSFDEWFADQVARWATTQKKPLTVLEKFFSNLGRRLKALFDAGRKEGLPDPDVKTFLDGLENAPIGPSVLVATMQGLPAQTPLTAAAAAAKPTPVGDTRDMPTRIEDFVRRNLSNFPESLQNTASRTAINLYTLGQKGVYGMSFGRDLIDLFAKALPSANAYFDIVVRRATEARILQQEVDKIMERTGGLSLEVRRDLNKFLADSTSKQQWGYQPTWRTDTVQIDPDMAVQYNTLKTKSPEAATVADEIFKYSYQTRNALRNAINTEIEGELTTAQFNKLSPEEQAQRREDAARRLRLLDTTLQNLKGPYAPLSRFGPYAVVAKSKEYLALQKIPYLERSKEERDRLQELKSNPDHYIVQFVSSAGEAQLTKSQLAKQFPSMEVESFERKVLTSELETMPWANLLRLKSVVATQFGADSKANANQAELINRLLTDMYISALAENSARKHNLPRATVAGFEQDMLKSFVTKGKSDAHFLAAIKTGTDTTEVLEQLGKEAKMSDAEVLEYNKTVPSERQVSGSRLERSQAFNELLLRHVSGMTYNPTPFQDAVLQFNSVWMLLSVPRYYIQNALQTYMVSLPVMAAKFGYGKSSSAITETYQELIKSMDGKWADFLSGKFDVDQMKTKDGKKYPDAELKFLKDMRDSGRIDIGLGYDLGHWESFSETTPIRKLNDTVHKMVALTRQVEIANRITAGMAAYRLAKASGMSEFDARSYAAQVLDQTQGDYSGFNAPRFFSSVPFGKFVFQFRKYQILQLSLLARNTYLMFKGATKEDRRLGRLVLRNVLGQTALATGALGLPITGIAYVLAAAFGEEEEPVDAERFLRSYLTDDYNLADFILKGIPAGLGVDVSAQFGFNTVFSILPYTDVDFTSREGFAKTLLGIGGPVMGTAANVADGFGYFSRGDYQKGFEMMLPNGLKHAMRAYRETFSDGVTRKNGDLVMSPDEFNFMQGILQGLGFSTTEVQRIRRTRQDLYEFETYFSNRTTQIRRDYVEARKSGDVEGMQEAKAAWLALQQSKKRVNFKPSPLLNLYSAPAEQRKREQRYQEQYRGLRE